MFKNRTVEPYPARITPRMLKKWGGQVRVWDTPASAIEGAVVLATIEKPTKVTVVEEQLDMFGSIPQRARIEYGRGKSGWVIYDMVEKPAAPRDRSASAAS